jgi:hypothetical protein
VYCYSEGSNSQSCVVSTAYHISDERVNSHSKYQPLHTVFQAVGPVLRIINALVRDRGVYICTAENTGGSSVASAVVEVERKWSEITTATVPVPGEVC